ncbi:MAG TPA: hypothetical protein GX526_01690 [Thermoanaerobacterales bacterium]|nr:hypothetical protein [Thermoanaerobacterales bacterium]
MTLFDLVVEKKVKSLSIIGMAKNVGKTVTLNYLIEQSAKRNVVLGLTSAGRDGEKIDAVFGTHKPAIWVPEGTLLATARKCVVTSDARIEILYNTEISTPLGEIIIGRTRESGDIELAGPATSTGIKQVIEIMKDFGGDLIIIDGALDRASSAAPTVTDGTILSTGAAIGYSIESIIDMTKLRVELFGLEELKNQDIRRLAAKIIQENKLGTVTNNGFETIEQGNALLSGKEISSIIDEDTKAIVIGGAITDRFMMDLIDIPYLDKIYIVVKDGVKVFFEDSTYKQLKRRGIKITVLDPINLLALTVNPYSPTGYNFDPAEFLAKIRSAMYPLPVYDVVLGRL